MTNEDLKRFFSQSVTENKNDGFARYDDLGKLPYLPILSVDLNNFTQMIAKTYYKHIGISSSSFNNDIVYYYDGTNFNALIGATASGVHILNTAVDSVSVGALRAAAIAFKTMPVMGRFINDPEPLYGSLLSCTVNLDYSTSFLFIVSLYDTESNTSSLLQLIAKITPEQDDTDVVSFSQEFIGGTPASTKYRHVISFYDADFLNNDKHLVIDFVSDVDTEYTDEDLLTFIKSCILGSDPETDVFDGRLNITTFANVTDVSKGYAFIDPIGLSLGLFRYGDVEGVYGIKSIFTPIQGDIFYGSRHEVITEVE